MFCIFTHYCYYLTSGALIVMYMQFVTIYVMDVLVINTLSCYPKKVILNYKHNHKSIHVGINTDVV